MTPDERREYKRRYYQANRDRILELSRQSYAANRERKREYARQWAAANPDRVRENRRRWEAANSDKMRALRKKYRATAKHRATKDIRKHGVGIVEARARMWEQQDGRCYLCTEVLDLTKAWEVHIDHDHDCCSVGQSCAYCRRGLACRRCNTLIGHVDEDPVLLHKIADNLESALAAARKRLAVKPVQEAL